MEFSLTRINTVLGSFIKSHPEAESEPTVESRLDDEQDEEQVQEEITTIREAQMDHINKVVKEKSKGAWAEGTLKSYRGRVNNTLQDTVQH